MTRTRRRLLVAVITAATVAGLAIAYRRGTVITVEPFLPTTSAQGVRCEVVAWPEGPRGTKGVRCVGVFDRPLDALWGPLTDYDRLPEAFDSLFYTFRVDALSGAAPGTVTLKGALQFWLMRFPFDMTLTHPIAPGLRQVRWTSQVPRFSTRGGWQLQALAPDRTRVEYLIDTQIAFLPDFLVRVVLRDTLAPVVRAVGAPPG